MNHVALPSTLPDHQRNRVLFFLQVRLFRMVDPGNPAAAIPFKQWTADRVKDILARTGATEYKCANRVGNLFWFRSCGPG